MNWCNHTEPVRVNSEDGLRGGGVRSRGTSLSGGFIRACQCTPSLLPDGFGFLLGFVNNLSRPGSCLVEDLLNLPFEPGQSGVGETLRLHEQAPDFKLRRANRRHLVHLRVGALKPTLQLPYGIADKFELGAGRSECDVSG